MRLGRKFRFPDQAVAVQVPIRAKGVPIVSPAFVEAVQGAGRDVQVWTIDEPDAMRQLYGIGVNAVMTDRPSVLKEVMQELQIWL